MTDIERTEVGPPRWVWVGLLIAVFVVVAFTATFVLVRAQDNATQLDRQDCARRINSEQQVARDAATTASRAVSRYYFEAVLDATSTRSVTQQQIDEFTALVRAADRADDVVNSLPDESTEVERRCPS